MTPCTVVPLRSKAAPRRPPPAAATLGPAALRASLAICRPHHWAGGERERERERERGACSTNSCCGRGVAADRSREKRAVPTGRLFLSITSSLSLALSLLISLIHTISLSRSVSLALSLSLSLSRSLSLSLCLALSLSSQTSHSDAWKRSCVASKTSGHYLGRFDRFGGNRTIELSQILAA